MKMLRIGHPVGISVWQPWLRHRAGFSVWGKQMRNHSWGMVLFVARRSLGGGVGRSGTGFARMLEGLDSGPSSPRLGLGHAHRLVAPWLATAAILVPASVFPRFRRCLGFIPRLSIPTASSVRLRLVPRYLRASTRSREGLSNYRGYAARLARGAQVSVVVVRNVNYYWLDLSPKSGLSRLGRHQLCPSGTLGCTSTSPMAMASSR